MSEKKIFKGTYHVRDGACYLPLLREFYAHKTRLISRSFALFCARVRRIVPYTGRKMYAENVQIVRRWREICLKRLSNGAKEGIMKYNTL